MSRRLYFVFAVLLCWGCSVDLPGDTAQSSASTQLGLEGEQQPDPESLFEEDNPHAAVELIHQGDASLLPYVEPMVRARQRLTIDQLEASLLRVTDGLGWSEVVSGEEVSLFTTLSATLGVPDYIETTREDLSTSTLFHRFLDEAARDACTKLVSRELETPSEERILIRHVSETDTVITNPDGVDANLQYLLMRYHSYDAPEGSPALEGIRWLFTSVAHVTQNPPQAWRAVCVALITHPYFYSH